MPFFVVFGIKVITDMPRPDKLITTLESIIPNVSLVGGTPQKCAELRNVSCHWLGLDNFASAYGKLCRIGVTEDTHGFAF